MDIFSTVAATGSYQFKINHSKTKDLSMGKCIMSPKFGVGGHYWIVKYFPQGNHKRCNTRKYVSFFLELQRESTDVTAEFGFVPLDKQGNISSASLIKFKHTFTCRKSDWGLSAFLERTKLEEEFVKDGYFLLQVAIIVKGESCNAVGERTCPFSFPRERIRQFRECRRQTDVIFYVDGQKFPAHRLFLAAHSPVFEAQFFGCMVECSQKCIVIKEMMPSVFKTMLDFMYNGSLPEHDQEVTDGFLGDLLVASDRYAVEPLRTICERRLLKSISLHTVLSLLGFAEKHSCSELKKECLEFIVEKDNLASLVLTEGYIELMQNYPSLLADLKEAAAK